MLGFRRATAVAFLHSFGWWPAARHFLISVRIRCLPWSHDHAHFTAWYEVCDGPGADLLLVSERALNISSSEVSWKGRSSGRRVVRSGSRMPSSWGGGWKSAVRSASPLSSGVVALHWFGPREMGGVG